MKRALVLLLLAAASLFSLSSSAQAQIELTEADPEDGAQLETPPDVVHLCFSQPVNIQDDPVVFSFAYKMPDGRSLGHRAVFTTDGTCVDVFPGLPDELPAGSYTFEWQVTAAEGEENDAGTPVFEQGSGTLRYVVTESSTVTPAPDSTPSAGTPEATGEADADGGEDDDDGPDILLIALITIGAVGGAAALATGGYLLRRRIGFEPHRPSDDDAAGGGDQH